MGCHLSKIEDDTEFFIEEDLAPTVISSLNASTNPSMPTDWQRNKSFMYSSTKYLKIKSIAAINLQKLKNAKELFQILEIWEHEVYEKLEELVLIPAEISMSVAESSNSAIRITIKAEGVRKFNFFYDFLNKIQGFIKHKDSALSLLKDNIEFIMELAPLTVTFYLSLGDEIDFGIGINKPIDRKNLSRFLQNSSDRKMITE